MQSIINHVSIGVSDLDRAVAFYYQVLATLGVSRAWEVEGFAVGYGVDGRPEFWVQYPYNKQAAQTANGVHFAFNAVSEQQVKDFFNKAVELGARIDGEPGPRPEYGPAYYGAFVYDLDGHKIEAMLWDKSKMKDIS